MTPADYRRVRSDASAEYKPAPRGMALPIGVVSSAPDRTVLSAQPDLVNSDLPLMPIDHRRGSQTSFVVASVVGIGQKRLAVTDGVDCWRALSDPFRRWDRCHRLVPRPVGLCNSRRNYGAGWRMDAGVPSSAQPLLEGRPAIKGVVNNWSPVYFARDEPRTGDLRVHLATPILQWPLRSLLEERSAGRLIATG